MIDSFDSSPQQFLVRPARHHDVEAVADILALSFYTYLLSPAPPLSPLSFPPSPTKWWFATGQMLVQQTQERIRRTLWRLMRWGIVLDLQHRLREDSPHHAWLVVVSAADPQRPLATLEICLRSGVTYVGSGQSLWTEILGGFWLPRSQYPYVFNVAVHPQFRRRGAARQLLQAAEQAVRGWGYGRIIMHVLDSNHGARHLYGEQGYQVVGVEGRLWSWLCQSPQKLVLQKTFSLPNGFSSTQPRTQ
ncbi:MAG: GNAT family N-acetyltransferase [Pseudanabaenaceae cyanobacterium]